MMRRAKLCTRAVPLLAIAAAAWLAPNGAAQEPDDIPAAEIEANADRALREMSAYLTGLKSFGFRADVTYDTVQSTGQKIQLGLRQDVSFQRPNQFRANVLGDEFAGKIYLNGGAFVMHDVLAKTYAQADVPIDFGEALDFIWDEFAIDAPLADLFYADPHAVLSENVQTGRRVGKHRVQGVLCDHLAFTQEFIDWQIWIEDGRQRVPRKIVITYKDRPGEPQYTALLFDWSLDPKLSSHIFRFEPPEESSRIEFMRVYEVLTPEREEQP